MTVGSHHQVYLRPELLYFGRDRIHLSSNTECELASVDARLIELVMRGYSTFGLLVAALGELLPGIPATTIETDLARTLTDPRSILEARDPPQVETPEIVVCDFTNCEPTIDGRKLASHLRRSARVVTLGLDERVRGDRRRNVSFATTKKAGAHTSWYEYLQWCRGFVGSQRDALLVLCGHQDAILFGDLTNRMRSVVVASPSWPSPTSPMDLRGENELPHDVFDATRALFYAMQFSTPDDWARVQRADSSDLAVLESYALRNATRVLHCASDQLAPLLELGRSAQGTSLTHDCVGRPTVSPPAASANTLVVVGSMEDEGRPLARYLQFLKGQPAEARPYERLVAVTPSHWLEVTAAPSGGIRWAPIERPVPASEIGCAIVLTGLLRNHNHALSVMARGVPTVFVPSQRPHPLGRLLPAELVLAESATASLRQLFARCRDPRDSAHVRHRTVQADFVRSLGIPAQTLPLVDRSARTAGGDHG